MANLPDTRSPSVRHPVAYHLNAVDWPINRQPLNLQTVGPTRTLTNAVYTLEKASHSYIVCPFVTNSPQLPCFEDFHDLQGRSADSDDELWVKAYLHGGFFAYPSNCASLTERLNALGVVLECSDT